MYIAEIVPARLRGMLGSVNQLAVTLGILSSYVMGALVHWQWLALFGAIPPALQVVFMFSMPETPRWSLEKNRRNEALIALQWLRGPDADNEKECDTIVDSFGEYRIYVTVYTLFVTKCTIKGWTSYTFAEVIGGTVIVLSTTKNNNLQVSLGIEFHSLSIS